MSRLDSSNSPRRPVVSRVFLPDPSLTVQNLEDPLHPVNDSSFSGKCDGAVVRIGGRNYVAVGQSTGAPWVKEADVADIPLQVTRKKSELVFTGVSVVIPTTATNLITLLKTLSPTSGTFAPFFNTSTDKLQVFPEDETLHFKLVMIGTWAAGANRSMELTFTGQVPDVLLASRNDAVTIDNLVFPTFFSVDADGFLANNGSTMTIKANGGTFTATTIKLIAEQSSYP